MIFMPIEKNAMKTAWGRNMVDEIKEVEGLAALYVGNLKNMFDAQKAVYDKVKSDLDAEQAAVNKREAQADEKTAYLEGEEAKIAKARSELESKYPVLEKREKDLTEKTAAYETDRKLLDETKLAVVERSKELDKKQEAIEARNAQLEKGYAEKDKGLQAYTERLEEEQKELNRRGEDLRKIEEDLKKRTDAIDEMDKMLKQKETDLAAKEADYSQRKGELENAYKDMENKIKELSAGMVARKEEPAPDTYKSLGGDVEKPTAERLTRKVKKMSIGKKTDGAPEIELAQTVTTDGKPTAAAAPTQAASVPQAAAEDVLYKHEFPIGQQDEVVKVLEGFEGMESSKMTGPDTKYMLTGRKAEKERNECDYSYNKGEVKVQFTTKNPALDAMLAGVKLGQKFTPIRVRPKDRDKKIKEFPDFADLTPKKTGTDEKGEYVIYNLNDEQKKRYNIKALPPKKAKADGQ